MVEAMAAPAVASAAASREEAPTAEAPAVQSRKNAKTADTVIRLARGPGPGSTETAPGSTPVHGTWNATEPIVNSSLGKIVNAIALAHNLRDLHIPVTFKQRKGVLLEYIVEDGMRPICTYVRDDDKAVRTVLADYVSACVILGERAICVRDEHVISGTVVQRWSDTEVVFAAQQGSGIVSIASVATAMKHGTVACGCSNGPG